MVGYPTNESPWKSHPHPEPLAKLCRVASPGQTSKKSSVSSQYRMCMYKCTCRYNFQNIGIVKTMMLILSYMIRLQSCDLSNNCASKQRENQKNKHPHNTVISIIVDHNITYNELTSTSINSKISCHDCTLIIPVTIVILCSELWLTCLGHTVSTWTVVNNPKLSETPSLLRLHALKKEVPWGMYMVVRSINKPGFEWEKCQTC